MKREMSELAERVTAAFDRQLYDAKDLAKEGALTGEMRGCVVRTAVSILDNWPDKLSKSVRMEVIDWFRAEYGICL